MENIMKNSEQLASDMLDLDGDFRKVKKTKLISAFADLTKMPTETARHVIDQFPVAIGNAVSSAKALFDKIPAFLEDEAKTHESMMNMLAEDDRQCWERIKDDSVEPAERERCYQRLESNKKHAHVECSENRKLKMNLYDHSGVILLGTVVVCMSILGVNGKLLIPGTKK